MTDGGGTPAPQRKRTGSHRARRRAREAALQGLYLWLLAATEPALIEAQLQEAEDFARLDHEHLRALLYGCIGAAAELDALLLPYLDRPIAQLSPVEHAVLWIGSYELQHCIEIPYRVALNEGVELAKSFGGTDGHRFVNGVLDKVAAALRPAEVAAARAARAGS